MIHSIGWKLRYGCLAGIILFSSSIILNAQEQQPSRSGPNQGFRRQSLVIDINARVFTDEQEVIWHADERRMAIPGSPVSFRLVGSNVVVAVQFTPFIRRQGNILVAQGQIWVENPGRGVSYYTLVQTIPMDFNEPLYFFPLGASNSSIEIVLTVNPYSDSDIANLPENE